MWKSSCHLKNTKTAECPRKQADEGLQIYHVELMYKVNFKKKRLLELELNMIY